MLEPFRLLEIISASANSHKETLDVYWYHVQGDREHIKNELEKLSNNIVVIIVRGYNFMSPNALADDLRLTLQSNKNLFVRDDDSEIFQDQCPTIILVSNSAMSISQISSPCELPSWFPYFGGKIVISNFIDIDKSLDLPVSAPESGIHNIGLELYYLDKVIVERLRNINRLKPNKSASFRSYLQLNSPSDFDAFLESATSSLQVIQNPSGFRPSARGNTVTSKILSIVSKNSPDDLVKICNSLSQALDLHEGTALPHESLQAVMLRSTERNLSSNSRVCRGLLVTVYCACQFVTTAAHSDDYPCYPLHLLRYTSLDLQRSMKAIRQCIEEQ